MAKVYLKGSLEDGVSLCGRMIKWLDQADFPLRLKLVQAYMMMGMIDIKFHQRKILCKLG